MGEKNREKGFTLIEMAVVLVIIGLLLGGVLKGQELINSAKMKNLANDFRSIPVFVYGYQDKFRALPGDDANAAAHLGAGTTQIPASLGAGNGVLDGAWNDPAGKLAGSETVAFWEHVRRANLAAGPLPIAADADLPVNAEGGRIGVESGGAGYIGGLGGSLLVCSTGIVGKFARQLDIAMDDGRTHTGSMRAVAVNHARGGPALDLTAIAGSDGTPYTVCLAF